MTVPNYAAITTQWRYLLFKYDKISVIGWSLLHSNVSLKLFVRIWRRHDQLICRQESDHFPIACIDSNR